MCIHPKAPLYVIQLEYSQRTPPGVQPLNIQPEGEAFFESLVFDPLDAQVTTFEVGKGPSGIAVAQGVIWVADQTGGVISVIDPAKNQTTDTVSLESFATPVDITGGGDKVWVSDRGKDCVIRVDAKARRFVTNIPVDKKPAGLAFGFSDVWVVSSADGTLSRIDPDGNRIKASVYLGGEPSSISIGAGSVWVGQRQISQLKDFLTQAGRGSPVLLPLMISGDAMDHYKGSLVSRISPANNDYLAGIPVGKGPLALLALVYRIDPANNKIVATIKVGRGPTALAFQNGFVWVTNAYDDDVLRIDPASNSVVGRSIPVNARPVAMVSDGRSLWVANFGDNMVSRVDPVSAVTRAN